MRIQLDRGRLERLTDALVDGVITREAHDVRRKALLKSMNAAEQELAQITSEQALLRDRFTEFFELWKSLSEAFDLANPAKKREMVLDVTSSRLVSGKELSVELSEPFRTVEKIRPTLSSVHSEEEVRSVVFDLVRLVRLQIENKEAHS